MTVTIAFKAVCMCTYFGLESHEFNDEEVYY